MRMRLHKRAVRINTGHFFTLALTVHKRRTTFGSPQSLVISLALSRKHGMYCRREIFELVALLQLKKYAKDCLVRRLL